MQCPSCGMSNPPHGLFCGYCGAPLPRRCPKCGGENPQNVLFCGHCGNALSPTEPSPAPPLPLQGERRFVVTLFAAIADFARISEQLDVEVATVMLKRYIGRMTDVIVQHEGQLDKYMGHGLMAVFGAPTAREDDAQRALLAALAMQEAIVLLDDPSISLQIGLACGNVVAAEVGGRGRREYTVMGHSVNLAYRLHEAAEPGTILISKELYELTRHYFSYQPVNLPSLQGWDEEVQAFALLGKRAERVPRRPVRQLWSPMVGREAEMTMLWRALEELAGGQGGIVSIVGELGIGKSRLIHQARERTEKEGFDITWLESSATETGATVRYTCLRDFVRESIKAPREMSAAQIAGRLRNSLEKLMPSRIAEIYPYLCHALDIPLERETSERLETLDGESLKWQTFRVVQEWLTTLAAQTPTALVFDDLHWADPMSAQLLQQILPLTLRCPLLVIGVYRPETDRTIWRLRELAAREHSEVYTEI